MDGSAWLLRWRAMLSAEGRSSLERALCRHQTLEPDRPGAPLLPRPRGPAYALHVRWRWRPCVLTSPAPASNKR